jgi:very-short-patch-repair endonuclease
MRLAVSPPSSGPSGHLLPAGEKREFAATSRFLIGRPAVKRLFKVAYALDFLFSPWGEDARRADEGGHLLRQPDDITRRSPGKTAQARGLREGETEEEYRLWSDLRNRRLNGYKFTRQIPLGPYVVDFVCREKSLIVEIDGFHHAESTSDGGRTLWLNRNGYSVLRFWNHEVLRERRPVLETILAALEGRIFQRDDILRFHPAIRQSEDPSK